MVSLPNRSVIGCGLLLATILPVSAQELTLHPDPGQCKAMFTLSATAHTVHGSFNLKRGEIRFDPATGKASGEIAFDATSGQTGNQTRDSKMHAEVLQSQQYREITFRPDLADGTLGPQGESTLQVHGLFGIHGSEHELTVPIRITRTGENWMATASFSIPYVAWGMKNPSNFFLRVGDTVNVELSCTGVVTHAP
jgi:polyisoprenoid-binding protein YceI